MTTSPHLRRGAVGLTTALIAATVTAGAASAHVSTEPSEVSRGETSRISFRVPNESPTSGTVKLELTFPSEHPISSLRVEEKPGWSAQITKSKLDKPITVEGAQITEAVRTVTWTANPGTRIGPDQFGVFTVLTSSLPDTTNELVIPAAQTYDNGDVAHWNMPPAPDGSEPESPAPTLKLSAAGQGGHGSHAQQPGAAAQQDNTALWLGGAGLLFGALALGVALGALLRSRRGTGETGSTGS